MNIEQARYNMIEQQIRPWDVLDSRVLKLFETLRREDFAPAAHRDLAFADLQIPLKDSEDAIRRGQVMLEPRIEARLLQDLQVSQHDRVLEVGTGSGFMAALLASSAQRVLSLEIDKDLAEFARDNLKQAGILNVEVKTQDASTAQLSGYGPFDVILLSGSVAWIPDHFLQLLAENGRLMAITGQDPVMRASLVHHAGHGLVTTQPWDVNIPKLENFPEPAVFQF